MTRKVRSTVAAKQTTAQRGLIVVKSFDYASLDAGTARQVQTTARRIRERVRQTLKVLIAVGNDLLAVKQTLPHGSFGAWLRTEFGWSERTARNFMVVAQRFGPKSATVADLPIDPAAAYLLSAPSVPEEASQEALRRAQNGERITASVAKEILGRFRPKLVRRERNSSVELPARKLWGQLVEMLESYRRRWNPRQVDVLARQLKDFADSLRKA